MNINLRFLSVAAMTAVMAAGWASVVTETTSEGFSAQADSVTIKVTFYTPSTVRVEKRVGEVDSSKPSYSVTALPAGIDVDITENGKTLAAASSKLRVSLDKSTGLLSFHSASGKLITKEASAPEFTDFDDCGEPTFSAGQAFAVASGEAIYGLGNLSHGNLSQRGMELRLMPGNVDDGLPLMQSSKGYGIFWDNYSPTVFKDDGARFSFTSEIGPGIDYYFMWGENADGVIGEIRSLTGDVPMFPLWTYGFWQSRERYKSQDETAGVVRRYRELGVPLDGIIQDWQYWGNNYLWNAMDFLNPQFNDPQKMVDDIHGMDAHAIISIWSSFGPQTKPYRQLDELGLLFDISTWPQSGIAEQWPPRMDYPSGVRVYNAYSPAARDIYWNNLSRLHAMGFDGWWMDSTEPDHFDGNMEFPTGVGSFRKVRGAYPLLTVGGVHDHQVDVDSAKRVFILTRSAWVGQQRYGCNVWTGDVASSWDMLRRQVPSHLNFTMTGNPNVNSDLGGFFCGHYNTPKCRAYDNPLFRELTVRWTQLGVFTPMMRSHGADAPREIYNFGKKGEPVYDALESAVKLRYRLLPYIYSTSWDVTSQRSSFMRPLVMDFPHDREGLTRGDEFMFGKSLLVAPVLKAQYTPETLVKIDETTGWDKPEVQAMVDNDSYDFTLPRSTEVYLPSGTDWWDFTGGRRYKGGAAIDYPTTLAAIPVFARAGSIVPIGPDVNYAAEKPWDNLELRVYPGADGEFTLYEDEGDNYNYTKGRFSTIKMTYSKRDNSVTIGERKGSFPGMLEERKFTVKNMATGQTIVADYSGAEVTLKF